MSTPDRIYKVCTAEAGAVIENLTVDPKADGLSADQFEDIYKFSDKHGVTHRHLWVLGSGAKENAIDINNRCTDLLFEDATVMGGAQSGVLAKGGCRNVTFRRIVFGSCGPRCDVLLGDWSDQSNDKTTGVVLDGLVRTSNEPVRVIVGRADWPKIIGGHVKILYFQSYLQKAYWWIKFATRKLFGGKLAFLMSCLAVGLMLSGCSTTGGTRWYAPGTWFSRTEATSADRAHVAEGKAEGKVDVAEQSAVHASHVEFAKAGIAASFLPPSRASGLVQRFLPNGLGLLDQIEPLTAAESADLRKLVSDLMSDNAATVAAAEQKQSAAETEAARLSRELTEAHAKLTEATSRADAADANLRKAFDRENALANDLRAQRARFWIAIGALVLVSGFALYAKLALGGVGAALHAAGAPSAVVNAIDTNLSTFGQWMIRSGRLAAVKTEAALNAQIAPPAP